MMHQEQLPFEEPHSIVEREFEAWILTEDGKIVRDQIVARALGLVSIGFRHYSIDALFQAVRFDRDIVVGPDRGYKLNNNHRSHMARYLMARHPELQGFFELRELRGRAWRKGRHE